MNGPHGFTTEGSVITTDRTFGVGELQEAKLHIQFHGRVIEHLGIDMYQSPVAAIAELISNAWDADATAVSVHLPDHLREGAEIFISDNGEGMTLAQCQDRYLKVGYNRRKDRGSEKTSGGRPVMGRKGIGKFAGFGIADLVEVESVSGDTGEKTVFKLDVERLTGGEEEYADSTPMDVEVVEYLPPDAARKKERGTRIRLQNLTLEKTPSADQFRSSMARGFLLLERAEEFTVAVNDGPISNEQDAEKIEFDFPGDYRQDQIPVGVSIRDGWGVETLPSGQEIQWRFVFYRETIREDDLSGVSIFSHHKLAQRPFFFNLSGGFGGQQGLSYLSGRVKAEFIDDQKKDLISTERQRINWESDDAIPLLEWGQRRTKALLRVWQERRAQDKVDAMNARMAPFSARLGKLENYEQRIVRRALTSIAKISILSDTQFDDLANAILTAWEGGRLRDLIDRLSEIISPEWDTFRKERSMSNLIEEIGKQTLDKEQEWNARVDLVLASGDQLLVLEFMRPGVTADWDHVYRFERYVLALRDTVLARRGSEFRDVTGLMVADKLERPAGFPEKLKSLRSQGMDATDWPGLLHRAKSQWQDYFDILFDRAPEDERMQSLAVSSVDSSDGN